MTILNHIKAALLYVRYYKAIQFSYVFNDREYHRLMKLIQETRKGKTK